ncbi:MAG: hypothetical protein ACOX88_05800 [Christensenellales bacterium]|jgi:hypothetical protein
MMKKYTKKVMLFILCAALLVVFAACRQLDVVGSVALSSFEEVAGALAGSIASDEANGGWALTAPDGSARFIWSADFSGSQRYDVMLEVDAQPFIDAGLDVDLLPDEYVAAGDIILIGTDLTDEAPDYDGEITPLSSFEQIVKFSRDSIGYHEALDHYGVDLEGGNMFEWAKDMSTNDKDIVFVLNPQPFIDAGVDPENVGGWVFAAVPVMDEKGNDIEVEKLLKPFEIQ